MILIPPGPALPPAPAGLAGVRPVHLTPHISQRLQQFQSVAPFLGQNFELLLARQGMAAPTAAYQVISNAFDNHAQARGVAPRTLLMQLLAQKRGLPTPIWHPPSGDGKGGLGPLRPGPRA